MLSILDAERALVEPATGCVLAAAEARRERFSPDDRVALVLCGSNVSLDDLNTWRSTFGL
jgi:threonine dehydratase